MSAYVAISRDKQQYELSTSGSIFPAIARYVISELNGMVCGAMFKDGELRHVLTDAWEDVERMQGSKYIESRFAYVIPDVLLALTAGSWVLFVGTPCQIAAIKAKVPSEAASRLLLVDLFCHGTPSQSLFFTYLSKLGVERDDFICATFRTKNPYDRSNYNLTVHSKSGVIERSEHGDVFVTAFKQSLSLQRKCYNCKFANLNRLGDISLGDCAARQKYLRMAPGAVLSTVLVNTPAGEGVWGSIKDSLVWSLADEGIEASTNRALRAPAVMPEQREQFLRDMDELPLEELEKRYTSRSPLPACKSFVKRLIPAAMRDHLCALEKHFVG